MKFDTYNTLMITPIIISTIKADSNKSKSEVKLLSRMYSHPQKD